MNAIIKIESSDENESNEEQTDNKSTALADLNRSSIPTATRYPNEKIFLCHICSKSFGHKHHLILHLKVHTDEKEYECEICARKFRQKSHVNQHKKIHSGKKEFACEFCAKQFLHRGDLKRHLKTHRAQLPFHCSFCADRFSNYAEQQSHEQLCKFRPYKCTICDFEAIDNANLEAHKTKHIGERRFICDICPKAFRLKQHLVVHLKTHVDEKDKKQIECTICNKRFSLKSHLTLHLKYHTGDKAFLCQYCSKRFVHRGDLNRHIKIHEKTPPPPPSSLLSNVECRSDNDSDNVNGIHTFGRHESDTDDHIPNELLDCTNLVETVVKEEPDCTFNESSNSNDHPENNEFVCEDETNQTYFCESQTKLKKSERIENSGQLSNDIQYSSSSMENTDSCIVSKQSQSRTHIQTHIQRKRKIRSQDQNHDSKKKFICDICLKHFRLKHHLVIHLKTHTGQKDYQCEICSKHFAQSSHLNLHLKMHTGEKAFPCPYCEKRFIHRGDLHRHCKIHRNELPFSCTICSRRFCDEFAKNVHENHCKGQINKCQMCDYETSVSSRFKTHMKVHTGERHFQCEICPKRFIHRQNLENHLKTHSNERSFQCDLCAKLFRLKAHLQRHSKVHKK